MCCLKGGGGVVGGELEAFSYPVLSLQGQWAGGCSGGVVVGGLVGGLGMKVG